MSIGDLMLAHLNHCRITTDDLKTKIVSLGFSLIELEKLFNTEDVKENWESFSFWIDNSGITKSIVKESMLIAKYLKTQKNVRTSDVVSRLPLTYIYELAKNKIELSYDMLSELEGANSNHFKSVCKELKSQKKKS